VSRPPFSKTLGHQLHNIGSSIEAMRLQIAKGSCASCLLYRVMRDPRLRWWNKLRNSLKHFRRVFSLVVPDRTTGKRKGKENQLVSAFKADTSPPQTPAHSYCYSTLSVLQFQKIVGRMFLACLFFHMAKAKLSPLLPLDLKLTRLFFFNNSYSTLFCQDFFVCVPATSNAVSTGLGILFIS